MSLRKKSNDIALALFSGITKRNEEEVKVTRDNKSAKLMISTRRFDFFLKVLIPSRQITKKSIETEGIGTRNIINNRHFK